MGWEIKVDYYEDEQAGPMQHDEGEVNAPTLGTAVEQALHGMNLRDRRLGSYQLTVTRK